MSEFQPVVSGALRALFVGASGIGKHHAKWLNALGAQVVAIVGSSPDSAAATAQKLQDEFGFHPRAYDSLTTMLCEEDPDLVHICTPPEKHFEHVMAVAPHRCHVLCEKPLTWDEAKSAVQLLDEARQMVKATSQPGRQAAVNLQYTLVPRAYHALCLKLGQGAEPPRQFFMHMDSKRERNVYDIIWRELSPHCLSVMRAFCGAGIVDYQTARLTLAERQCRAQFVYEREDGGECECEIVVGTETEGPLTRRFGINGLVVDYEGRNDAKGVFRTYLKSDGVEAESDDFMYLSMRELLLAVTGQIPEPPATLAEGLRNEGMQLEILARGKRV
ncbi:MAG: Gfo/Idh/MocA family oxidoreductase [Armatimonadia bacterium]